MVSIACLEIYVIKGLDWLQFVNQVELILQQFNKNK